MYLKTPATDIGREKLPGALMQCATSLLFSQRGFTTFCIATVTSLQNQRGSHQPLLRLLGRASCTVCLGSRQRNMLLLICPLHYLILLKLQLGKPWLPTSRYGPAHTRTHELPELPETASNQRLFYLHNWNHAYSSFLLKSRRLLWEGSFTTTTVICTGPYHGSGPRCPQYFILELNSKPALQSSTSSKASLKTIGYPLPLWAERGSNIITVWRTGLTQRLIQHTMQVSNTKKSMTPEAQSRTKRKQNKLKKKKKAPQPKK